MSVFQVSLTNKFGGPIIDPVLGAQLSARLTGQGSLDEVAQSTGTSIQRTMYCMGPNKINRKLVDGATFTDCNYWKQFATPVLSADSAFIKVISDDGSTYIAGQINTFPRVYNVTVANGATLASGAQTISVLSDNGGPASFVQINVGANGTYLLLNGASTASLALKIPANGTQTFAVGDFPVSSLVFIDNNGGGALGGTTLQVLVGVQSLCNS